MQSVSWKDERWKIIFDISLLENWNFTRIIIKKLFIKKSTECLKEAFQEDRSTRDEESYLLTTKPFLCHTHSAILLLFTKCIMDDEEPG